ncbi:MAG TPA: cytochrome C [Rhodocyclaceae bacterium]|nr:MAG: hypothetical protein AUK49_06650 [Betaproteobacteria bacterium CG2_30_68_42]PIV71697.1 MAG: cytochrome C [Rhodocyclales bacterium CG17_big_fil_post_rev_8_21_14_2_50_68_7]PIX76239.1 MAG: cytochrome C [Rhodocyclales bacterium CG_4_10_14_3_um_filter_68_10]HCX33937.1 cytochrome C [Rhodocyclaceae bacterium]
MRTALMIAAAILSTAAWAEREHERDRGRDMPATTNAKWKAECSSCHMAYPPALLPERSWRKLMGGLDRHFGENAGLDAATAAEITSFLAANAADRNGGRRGAKMMTGIGSPDVPLRITETPYFRRKHREVNPAVFKRAAIASPANCAACHAGAESGSFSEHDVRIPR